MYIGRRIYYNKATGNVIQDTGQRSGAVIETTIEQDFVTFSALAERIPETVGCLQLSYGDYEKDFIECDGYMIDISGDLPVLFFSYPDKPTVYRAPSSDS